MKREMLGDLISALLITLWVYAAVSKLIDLEHSRGQMLNQPIPRDLAELLTVAIPVWELLLAAGLLVPWSRNLAYWLSAATLLIFSMYILLAMSGSMGRIPCSCGGILSKMSWSVHLFFNGCFVLLAFIGVYLNRLHHIS